jgi:hypothetical protein
VVTVDPTDTHCHGEVRWFYNEQGTLLRRMCERRYQAEYGY